MNSCPRCYHPAHAGRRCYQAIVDNVGDELHYRPEVVELCRCGFLDELMNFLGTLEISARLWLPGDSEPDCDCALDSHHRWDCHLTPIWAQTIRDLDCNPWGRWSSRDVWPQCRSFGCGSPLGHDGDHDAGSLTDQIARQNAKNARWP